MSETSNNNYLALFASARKVVVADDICRQAKLNTTVIHVPKRFSSECGMCLRLPQEEVAQFESIMKEAMIAYQLHSEKE